MNRNVESHFAQLPSIDIKRSIFDRSSELKTSFNAADLIPIYLDEVLPGDSFRMTSSKVVRAQTMLTPVMDNMYLDTYFFFVPMRLVWDHAKEFFGENSSSAWTPATEYQIPSISSPLDANSQLTNFEIGTIADYFGLPTYYIDEETNTKVPVVWDNNAVNRPSALPFRAYAKICDEWFRDENLTDPLNIPTGDSNQTGSNGSSYINDVANGGKPFKVAKYHDYFTSCLPNAQKIDTPINFNLLNNNMAPVGTRNETARVGTGFNDISLRWKPVNSSDSLFNGFTSMGLYHTSGAETGSSWQSDVSLTGGDAHRVSIYPTNLWADLSSSLGAITINELRLAFQLQKWYEKAARGGTRYIEILKQHFGVTSPDARLQRTEYLGGNRIPLNVHEVTNSAQSQSDFLGDIGAKSATSDIHEDFERSFTEHGFVIGVCCVRTDKTYAQGLDRMWTRRTKFDYYWPVLSNLGEMGVKDCEIFADSTSMANDSVFGFQECWADYRYKNSKCTGEMRPGIANSLASWHFADFYTSKPTLSDAWIREDKTNIDRTLAVTSAVANQFFADFYFECICTRAMPTYSIPGLIDHH